MYILGTISQSYGAFNHILGDFSILINQFESLSAFSAGLTRLSTFLGMKINIYLFMKYTYIFLCIYTCLCVFKCICIQTYIYIYIYIYMYVFLRQAGEF
jgi:hypothetical protein